MKPCWNTGKKHEHHLHQCCSVFLRHNIKEGNRKREVKIKIHKTVILPVVLYGCETWSLALREEHRLRVLENRVLRKIFGPKREEGGSCRKLHKEELHSLYSSPKFVRVIKSRRMRWAGHVARMGKDRCLQGFGWEARREENTEKT
jgi:hypothetical protein